MSRVPSRLSFAGNRVLIVMQVFLLIATLFAPIPVAAQDPTGDPGASAMPSTEPAATPEPTPDPTSEPTPEATPEPPAASPDPTPEPSAEPPAAEPPAATPEPTPEQPAPSPDATPAPTTEPSTPTGTPTIQSDLADYPPGGLVTLTGSGWQPGESVHIYVNDDWGSSWSRNVDVTADASGAIVDQFNLPNWFVAVYRVLATGAESGLASTSFTDASLMVKRGPTGNPPNLSFNIGVVRGFSTNTCSSGGDARPDVTVSTDAGSSVTGLGSGSFVKLTAPTNPTSPSGYQFVNWTAESDSPSTGFPNTALSICVRNPTGSVDDVYRANYQRSTTTTVTRTTGSASNSYGDALVFTATVTSLAGNPSSAGNVTFKDGAAVLCAAVALAGNQATCSGSSLNVAGSPHSITAVYSGASGPPAFSASTSPSLSQTISKATLVVDANDQSRDYGDPNPVFDATVTGFKNGETLATSGVAGSPLCSTPATATSPVSGSPYAITCALGSLTASNYSFIFTPGALTITKASSTTTVTCPASVIYSGSARTPCSASVTGAGGLNQAVTVTYLNNTNAGTATANASYAGDANHTGSSDSDTFAIDRANAVCTVTAYDVVYDAAAHTATGSCLGVEGETLAGLDLSGTTHTNAGTYADDPWTFTDVTGNYNNTAGTVADEIDRAPSSTVVTFEAGPYTYRGTSFTATALATGVGGLSTAVVVVYSGDCTNVTDHSGCTATATFAGDSNHNGSGDTKSITILKKNVSGAFTVADKVWDGTNLATVVSRSVSEVIPGDMVSLSGGTATFATSVVGTWTVTLSGAALTGPDAGNYNLTSVGTDTAAITTAFRIVGFDSPVDMTVEAYPRIYNSVKNGQTVPLKFRVFNLDGTEVTSTVGLSAWAKSVACVVGEVDPVLLPTELASNTGLRRTGDRFHFNWAVPKAAGQCYRVFIQTVDGSTEMVGSFNSSTKLEAYFRSK